jgi:hypothetical protein
MPEEQPLFCYIASSFAPQPDQFIADLWDCFNVDGVLTINYSVENAYG